MVDRISKSVCDRGRVASGKCTVSTRLHSFEPTPSPNTRVAIAKASEAEPAPVRNAHVRLEPIWPSEELGPEHSNPVS